MREQDVPILNVYADALADAAERQIGSADALYSEALEAAKLMEGSSNLLRFLEKPTIGADEKSALIKRVFKEHLAPLLLNLGFLLVEKSRGALWSDVLKRYVEIIDERRNVYPAEVFTAHALPEADRVRLRKGLEVLTGKDLHILFVERPDLIGGVLFRQGDTMIDYTLRGFLTEARSSMRAVKLD